MSAVIPLETLSEVLFPGPHTDDPALSIVVLTSKKGIERVIASCSRRVRQSLFPVRSIIPHHAISEMKRLSVPFPRAVDPVKKCSDSRNEGKPSKAAEIKRSIKRRRYKNMRESLNTDGVQRTEGFADDQLWFEFIHPRGDLPRRDLRIEVICAHNDPHPLRPERLIENRGNTAVTATAHSVYI